MQHSHLRADEHIEMGKKQMSELKKLLGRGTKVRIARAYGAVGEPLGIIVSDKPYLTSYMHSREDYYYVVHFITPTYDLAMQGPFQGANVCSEYMTPIGHGYSVGDGPHKTGDSTSQHGGGYICNIPAKMYREQMAMFQLYGPGMDGSPSSKPSVLSADERRALCLHAIEVARSEHRTHASALQELQDLIRALQVTDGEAQGTSESQVGLSTWMDRCYALKEALRMDDFFEGIVQRILADIDTGE